MENIPSCLLINKLNPVEIQIQKTKCNDLLLQQSYWWNQYLHRQCISSNFFLLMLVLIKMIKHQQLVISQKLKQWDTIFSNHPSNKLNNSLLFQLKNMISLFIFTVQYSQNYFSLSFTIKRKLHIQQCFNIFEFEFREWYFAVD